MDRELLLYRSECSMYKRDLPAHFAGDVFCIWPCSETLLYGKVSAIVKNQKPIKKTKYYCLSLKFSIRRISIQCY